MTTDATQNPAAAGAAIHTNSLTFSYGGPNILRGLKLTVPKGARCLLGTVPAGGGGRLSRRFDLRLVRDEVLVNGQHAYFNTPDGITYLGPEWVQNPVTKRDVKVSTLLESHSAADYPERLAALMHLLEIDPTWRTHEISDGQRRRVQLLLGLIRPFDVALLDEVTVDLDVLARRNLLDFLRRECEERGCTVVYCTHIFDGMGNWPTHVAHLRHGEIMSMTPFDQLIAEANLPPSFDSPLLQIVEKWLVEDRKYREANGLADGEVRHKTKWDELKDGDKFYTHYLQANPN
ncbi:CCR4-NOT regulatory complex component [Blastocladiella emersonii ATCC 22665]|nr:CCR4-NOT regulatory complex component [Blastocladiella emersonii ATCC 22665]